MAKLTRDQALTLLGFTSLDTLSADKLLDAFKLTALSVCGVHPYPFQLANEQKDRLRQLQSQFLEDDTHQTKEERNKLFLQISEAYYYLHHSPEQYWEFPDTKYTMYIGIQHKSKCRHEPKQLHMKNIFFNTEQELKEALIILTRSLQEEKFIDQIFFYTPSSYWTDGSLKNVPNMVFDILKNLYLTSYQCTLLNPQQHHILQLQHRCIKLHNKILLPSEKKITPALVQNSFIILSNIIAALLFGVSFRLGTLGIILSGVCSLVPGAIMSFLNLKRHAFMETKYKSYATYYESSLSSDDIEKNSVEAHALNIGLETVNWKGYLWSYTQLAAYRHPGAVAGAMRIAEDQNEAIIDKIRSLKI